MGILRPQTESLQLETQRLLFPKSANIVFGRETCPKPLFTFFLLLTNTFCLFKCIEPFPYCSISEPDCLIFDLLSVWCYLDSLCQTFVSFGGYFLVVDSVKCAILRPQTGRLQLETQRLLFSSFANFICGRETRPEPIFTFFLLLIHNFCLFRCMEPFPNCSVSESDCLIFRLLSFLCYLDSGGQLLGSYGGHVLVLDPVKWANCGRELTTVNLKRKDSCLHHLQTLFVEGRLVRQL